MSQDIPGLVETSTNLASVKMKPNNVIRIETSQRSSILSARDDMANTVRSAFQLAGANVPSVKVIRDGSRILIQLSSKWQQNLTNDFSV